MTTVKGGGKWMNPWGSPGKPAGMFPVLTLNTQYGEHPLNCNRKMGL